MSDGWVNPGLSIFTKNMREIKARMAESMLSFRKADKSARKGFHELSKIGVDQDGHPVTLDEMLHDVKRRLVIYIDFCLFMYIHFCLFLTSKFV